RKASPDRCGARGRELLRAHDCAQAHKAGRAPAQSWAPGKVDELAQPRVGTGYVREAEAKVILSVQEARRHPRSHTSSTACANDRGSSCGRGWPTLLLKRRAQSSDAKRE